MRRRRDDNVQALQNQVQQLTKQLKTAQATRATNPQANQEVRHDTKTKTKCHGLSLFDKRVPKRCENDVCIAFMIVCNTKAVLLRERCATHVKERRAVLTIMEQKIKKLVSNAAQEARSIVFPSGRENQNISLLESTVGQRLSHELKTLSRLVNASIAALKNSSRQK